MEVTPARLKYWESMKGKPYGHKTNNGKTWKSPDGFSEKMRAIALADGRVPKKPIGWKASQETLEKMSKVSKESNSIAWCGKDRSFMKTEEYRKSMSIAMKKLVENGTHNFWKGGKTQESKLLRSSVEYKLWREQVFKRDNYTCQICGVRGVEIQADHIKKFADYPELRFDINNGRTLCVPCHRQTPTWGNNKMSTAPALA